MISLNLPGWGMSRTVRLLCLILSVSMVAPAGQFAKRVKKPDAPNIDALLKPQLLNADTDPTLRYPIASFSGWSVFSTSYGWLDVTRKGIHYSVVDPPGKVAEGFSYSAGEISEVKLVQTYVTFRTPAKKHTIFYIAQDRWGSIHSGPGAMRASSEGAFGTASILMAMQDFDRVLAMVKPPPPPAPPVAAQPIATPPLEPKPAAPPSTPAIVLSAPAGAGANQVVEVDESPLVIRGVTMDSSGIPVVTINGSAANMRPQNTQAAEFWSDPLPLQPGGNRFQISASNAAHMDATLVFIVHYTPQAAPPNPRAVSKQEIVSLLQGGVASARIAEIVKDRGLKFTPSANDLTDIRKEGGTDELIRAIQQAAVPPQ